MTHHRSRCHRPEKAGLWWRLLLPRTRVSRYGLAAVTVGLALLVAWLLTPLTGGMPVEIFFAAVILSLLFGRLGPGLLALVLAVLCIDFFFLPPIHSLDFKPGDVLRLSLFSLLALVIHALATARGRLAARLRRVAEEMRQASVVQNRLFPAPPSVAGFDIGAECHPVGATGGDYFDFFPLKGDAFGIALGDVCGHGLGPALLAASVRAYLRVLPMACEGPGEVLTAANRLVCEDTRDEFITLFFGRVDPAARTLWYASAGHPAYAVSASGGVVKLDGDGLPLGVMASEVYPSGPCWDLEEGQTLLVVSDGILEAASPTGTLFGLERLLEVVRSRREEPARVIAAALCQAALAFTGPGKQKDDMTAVVVKVLGRRSG